VAGLGDLLDRGSLRGGQLAVAAEAGEPEQAAVISSRLKHPFSPV
jgi:hypothetical protein